MSVNTTHIPKLFTKLFNGSTVYNKHSQALKPTKDRNESGARRNS